MSSPHQAIDSTEADPSTLKATISGTVAARRLVRRNKKAATPREAAKQQITEPTLESKLIACLQKSNFHDPEQEYAPLGHVRDLITPEVVKKAIWNYEKARRSLVDVDDQARYEDIDPEFEKDLIAWIPELGYRTFATAIVSGFSSLDLIHFMGEFSEHLTDEDLPLDSAQNILEKCVQEAAKIRNFCSQRWSFLAPVFSPNQYDYKLSNNCIFPFEKDATKSRTGAFGSVSKVKVHLHHQEHQHMEHVSVLPLRISSS